MPIIALIHLKKHDNVLSTKLIRICILSLIVTLSSCCGLHTEIDYQYSEVVIKRIDVCGKTTFHYKNPISQNAGIIWAEYSGINDGFSGYLEFKSNGKVILYTGDGYFQHRNLNTKLFEMKDYKSYNRPQIDSNICMINFTTQREKRSNTEEKTGITITYNIDNNEWW